MPRGERDNNYDYVTRGTSIESGRLLPPTKIDTKKNFTEKRYEQISYQ